MARSWMAGLAGDVSFRHRHACQQVDASQQQQMLQTAQDSETALRHQVAEAAVAAAAAQEADHAAAEAAAAAATAAAASAASRKLLVEELSAVRATYDTLREAHHRSATPLPHLVSTNLP